MKKAEILILKLFKQSSACISAVVLSAFLVLYLTLQIGLHDSHRRAPQPLFGCWFSKKGERVSRCAI